MTNTLQAYIITLHLAYLTGRVTILSPFSALHIGNERPLAVGTVFDLPRLTKETGIAAIDWEDVKLFEDGNVEYEELGCWSVQIPFGGVKGYLTTTEQRLGLDTAYTPVPKKAFLHDFENPSWLNVHILYALAFNLTRLLYLQRNNEPSFPTRNGHMLDPDEHLMCFDFLYDVGSAVHYEWDYEWMPAWQFAGRHLYFHPEVEKITRRALLRTFGLSSWEPVPPFIGVHIRRGDFMHGCMEEEDPEGCLPSLSNFEKRVREVQDELATVHGLNVTRVLVASDETSPEWWAELTKMGWVRIDYTQETDERFGKWLPVVVDTAALAMAHGFVGTERSSVSMMAAHRVRDWNNGVARKVNWGYREADDHFNWNGTHELD